MLKLVLKEVALMSEQKFDFNEQHSADMQIYSGGRNEAQKEKKCCSQAGRTQPLYTIY